VSGGAATVAGRRGARRRRPRAALRRALRALPEASPRLRRRLLALSAACLVLAAGYQFSLRDSSLVAVEKVTITGLTTRDAERVRVSLAAAARTMTTLHVDREDLERAIAGYPVVRDLEVAPDFPHAMRIHVVEHHPAALAVGQDGRIPVAADGTVLRGLPVEGKLPTVDVEGTLSGARLRDRPALAATAVAGAAPDMLRTRIAEVERRPEKGLVADLRDGPELIFGDASRARAKWAAAARVLADLEARGATYIDLRIPGRPAAGGLPAETVAPVAPAGATGALPPVAGAAAITDPATTTDPGVVSELPAATDPSATGQTGVPEPSQPTAPASPQTAPVTGGEGGGATAAPAP
jgi:cell division protein FtsQ